MLYARILILLPDPAISAERLLTVCFDGLSDWPYKMHGLHHTDFTVECGPEIIMKGLQPS